MRIEYGETDALYGRMIKCIVFEDEGWSYSFPGHKYFNKELAKSLRKNGYDFSEYDRFLLRNHFNADRIRMTCERLLQPMDLSGEMKQKLFSHIEDRLDEALNAIAFENAADELKLMMDAGFFNENNIDAAIDVLNKTESREMLTYLMDYKHENLQTADFDFSI